MLPGVGAFRDAIARLREADLADADPSSTSARGKPFLGICLGLQLLFTRSYEDGVYDGLDLFPGEVVRFPDEPGLKVPHMGWNQLRVRRRRRRWPDLPDGDVGLLRPLVLRRCRATARIDRRRRPTTRRRSRRRSGTRTSSRRSSTRRRASGSAWRCCGGSPRGADASGVVRRRDAGRRGRKPRITRITRIRNRKRQRRNKGGRLPLIWVFIRVIRVIRGFLGG